MNSLRLAALKIRLLWLNYWLRNADMEYALAVFDMKNGQSYSIVEHAAKRYSTIREKIRRTEVRHAAIKRVADARRADRKQQRDSKRRP